MKTHNMNSKKFTNTVVIALLFLTVNFSIAKGQDNPNPCEKENDRIDEILDRLTAEADGREFFQANIEYLVIQPLFESKTLRKGQIYYANQKDLSALRIDFKTVKQDDEKEREELEQYVFDGIWLTRVDYQMKSVKKRQFSDPNSPQDPFALASRDFPIVGFTRTDDLKKDFDLSLVEEDKNQIHLNLKVKKGSYYADDYTAIDFWVDKKLFIPTRIKAVSTEEDVFQIDIIKPKVNNKINKKIFEIKYPADFNIDSVVQLEKNDNQN